MNSFSKKADWPTESELHCKYKERPSLPGSPLQVIMKAPYVGENSPPCSFPIPLFPIEIGGRNYNYSVNLALGKGGVWKVLRWEIGKSRHHFVLPSKRRPHFKIRFDSPNDR